MAATNKQKRTNLSLKRKIALIENVEKGAKRKKDIAKDFGISPGSISQIMKEKEKLRGFYYGGEVNPKTSRPGKVSDKHDDVDRALLEWFKVARGNNIPISGPVLKKKANEFATIKVIQ